MEHTTESDEKKRPYHSRVRQRQAEETRQRILKAARSLFESQGYATTLEAIAKLAEVSPKTLGAVFGSKRALLAEVINPEAFSTHVRQLIEELRATADPSRRSHSWPRLPVRLMSRWQVHWNCCGLPVPWHLNWRMWRGRSRRDGVRTRPG